MALHNNMKLNLQLLQFVSLWSGLVVASAPNFGVGLSIIDLNNIKKHFVQENQSKSKVNNVVSGYNPDRNIYKNKSCLTLNYFLRIWSHLKRESL